MSTIKSTLLRKVLMVPLHAGNIVIGGNTLDKLRKIQDPKVQRILRRAVKPKGFVNHSRIGKMIAKTGHKKAMMSYGSERLKTHAARAAVGGALATYALKRYRENRGTNQGDASNSALLTAAQYYY